MGRLLTEFIGTFFLVLTIGLSVPAGSVFAPLTIGLVLTALVYMGGPISGAHYNPAVSLGVLLHGGLGARLFGAYVVTQLLGAMTATVAVQAITGSTFALTPGSTATPVQAFLVEAFFTFALMLVIFNVAMSRRAAGNSYYGLAIGFTIAAGAFAGGGISGGAFNPAVGIGPAIVHAVMGGGSLGDAWLYLLAPTLGAVLALPVFRFQEALA